MTEGGREQDQERSHKKKGRPSPETVRLLTAWQDALRAELRAVVDALEAKEAGTLFAPGASGPGPLYPLEDPRRDRFVSRGIAIAKELGASIDDTPAGPEGKTPAKRPPRRRARVDFGGA